jgi:uncharacterized protein YkwD
MRHDVPTRRRRLTTAIGASAAAAALVPTAAPAAPETRCADSGGPRPALLCLVNRERRAAGLAPLRRDRRIARAAGRHARDMVRRGYFAHRRGGGPDLGARLSRAGWRGTAWGEAIAYGCGERGSPRAIVRGWLASPSHRAILLGTGYRRAGVGLARPAQCGEGGATWVLDAGRR